MPAETPAPQGILLTSSMRRVDTPTRCISVMTSFHAGLAPLVTFDSRGGEAHAFQLDHYECDLA